MDSPKNRKRKEKIYVRLYHLSIDFETNYLRLLNLMQLKEESCPELIKLEEAIKEVINACEINEMNLKYKHILFRDIEHFGQHVDKFFSEN